MRIERGFTAELPSGKSVFIIDKDRAKCSCSLAVDLDLGRVPEQRPTDERGERELLNRLRAYSVCYIMDRCHCINLGKPAMMPENDVRTAKYSLDYTQTDALLTS